MRGAAGAPINPPWEFFNMRATCLLGGRIGEKDELRSCVDGRERASDGEGEVVLPCRRRSKPLFFLSRTHGRV